MSGSQEKQKSAIKEIIKELHQGLSPEKAKEKFETEVGSIQSVDIAEIEQELLEEGELTSDEIKKFCNVHALLFQSALEKVELKEQDPAHPVSLFKQENREIEKITAKIKEFMKEADQYELNELQSKMQSLLEQLKKVDIHYVRKEQQLFPYLEKYGYKGPTTVMWGKDDEVRELIKESVQCVSGASDQTQLNQCIENSIAPLVEEVEGMIFREENILFPTALEKLQPGEWGDILKESDQVGYCYIERPAEIDDLIGKLKAKAEEQTVYDSGKIQFPTGELGLKELTCLLNSLPIEITFVDKDDRARYFTDHAERIFVRTKQILGRKVENCHPPKSLDKVEAIVEAFKKGERTYADFWINLGDKFVYILFKPI